MQYLNTLLLAGAMTYISFFGIFIVKHQGLSAICCFIFGITLIYFKEELNKN